MSIYPFSSRTLSSSSTNMHGPLSLPSSINPASSSSYIPSLTPSPSPSPSPSQIAMECDNTGGKGNIKIIIPVAVVPLSVVAFLILMVYRFLIRYRPGARALSVGNAPASSDRWAFDAAAGSAAGSESPIRSEGSSFSSRALHPQIHL